MTITITQRCNGCDKVRDLRVGFKIGTSITQNLEDVAKEGGWRPAQGTDTHHLCPDCIGRVVEALKKLYSTETQPATAA